MSDSPSFAQRRASGLSVRSASRPLSASSPHSQHWQTHSRKSSQSSGHSMQAGYDQLHHSHMNDTLNGLVATHGLGSLADELQDGWDDEGGEESEYTEDNIGNTLAAEMEQDEAPVLQISSSPTKSRSGSPPKLAHGQKDSIYDGSEYGDDTAFEHTAGITPGLERQMADIEALARLGADTSDVVWSRFATSLKDLPSQAEVENNTGRLVTAYAAVSSQLTNQSRAFATTTHSIVSPFAMPPSVDDVEEILPLVTTLVTMLPKPPAASLNNLHTLNSQTTDLLATLSSLSDTLYMVRQTSTTASRKMRAAKELVENLNKEMTDAEEGERWLERGRWDQRIRARQARKTCEEMVDGFEEVCNSWRQRLVEMNGGSSALDTAAA